MSDILEAAEAKGRKRKSAAEKSTRRAAEAAARRTREEAKAIQRLKVPRRFLRFVDLQAMGVINNWPSLRHLIEHEQFPPGLKSTPHTRLFPEDEVLEWLDARPST